MPRLGKVTVDVGWGGMLSIAILLGAAGVRVGFEDNVYLRKGQLARSNAELVEDLAGVARQLGRTIATPDEARGILSVGRHLLSAQ